MIALCSRQVELAGHFQRKSPKQRKYGGFIQGVTNIHIEEELLKEIPH